MLQRDDLGVIIKVAGGVLICWVYVVLSLCL